MDDWQKLLSEGVNNIALLKKNFPEIDTDELKPAVDLFPVRINRYFLDVIKQRLKEKQKGNGKRVKYSELAKDPLLKQVLPSLKELETYEGEEEDPLTEEEQSPVPNIVHRYPDRCLFYVSFQCAFYCRFCTRKRKVGDASSVTDKTIEAGLDYIKRHTEIRDVIVSGGDPLMLKDEKLESIISGIRAIQHVEIIRIGTRIPCALPQRVTDNLVSMLKKYQPIYVMVHFNHPDEITPEAEKSLAKFADGGFPLNNQTVLLKGVNDDAEIIKNLCQKLLKNRVRPYYIYQADLVKGTGYFRTSVEKGLEIMSNLRGYTSGLAIPLYVIDAPNGAGKIPILPQYVVDCDEKNLILHNYKGDLIRYPQHREVEFIEQV